MEAAGIEPGREIAGTIAAAIPSEEPITPRAAPALHLVSENCQQLSIDGTLLTPAIIKIAKAWPHLSPHIRDAICTLISTSIDE